MIYADHRRIGDHGIGRFAKNILASIDYTPVSLTTDPDSPFDPWRLTKALARLTGKDLFFSPGYNPPLKCPAPFVFTLHDLNHLDRPENSGILKRLYYASIVKRACRQSARILTVSEFSRQRIVDWFRLSPAKVVNVGCGVGVEFHPQVTAYDAPFPYLLCVSNRRGHKNEFRQIEAFARSGLASEVKLLLTGDRTPDLAAWIARHHMSESVSFLGRVPEDVLPSLYKGAQALTFVSLYEGFGLPMLEAMACGTPVLTSNVTALPEIADQAALLVDPTSVEEIAEGMKRILCDTSVRSALSEKGRIRARWYSWENSINKVREVLDSSTS